MNIKVNLTALLSLSLSLASSLARADACSQPSITTDANYRYIVSNGIPCQHGQFPNAHNPNTISAQSYHFRVPLHPQLTSQITQLQDRIDFGVGLDGVPFDPGTAEWYNNDRNSGWHYDAMSPYIQLGLDQNHAHVQPNGAYHYHGLPSSLYSTMKAASPSQMTMIGYAADGFPIYALYGYAKPMDASSPIIEMQSSYQLRTGNRPNPPGGTYDGRFMQDFVYVAGAGNLDECNGVMGVTPEYPAGIYHYFITDNYPYVPRCFKGNPDSSFIKTGGPGMQGQGRMQGPGMGRRPPPPPMQGQP